MKAALIAALAVGAGCVSGLVGGVLAVRWQADAARPGQSGPAPNAERAAPAPQVGAPIVVPRHEVLGAATPGPAPGQALAREEPRRPGSSEDVPPEEKQRKWRENYDRKLARVEQEARDPKWSPRAETAFRQDLTKVATSTSAEVLKIDCRTASCLATLEWGSYAAAKSSWPKVLHHDYAMGCASIINVGPEPADASRRHQATVVFECDEVRANEVAANTGAR